LQISRKTLSLLGFNATGDLGHLTAYTSRRVGTVWFDKAPPLKPPSAFQLRQRDKLTLAAQAWRILDDFDKQRWHDACRLAHLYIHGYNLWIWWHLTRARAGLSTIERQSGLALI
jgi:hypothetical protein